MEQETNEEPRRKTKAAIVAEQKRFKKRIREAAVYIMAVVCVIVFTIGELRPESGMPSWSEMLGQMSDQPQEEPTEYAEELSGEILMSVHAIDVGQGDCTLVRLGDVTVLIDAGENGKGSDVLDYLYDIGIKKLDYVIGTHPHSDHIGGLDTVLEKVNVGTLIIPQVDESLIPTGRTYTDFLDAALAQKEEGMKVDSAEPGTVYKLTDYAEMRILSPLSVSYTDLNDYSVAVLITCGDVSFFSAGDITHLVERQIMEAYPDVHADLMKVSHHGSGKSNLRVFIDRIEPKYAYICCGRNNDYGHPFDFVLDIFEECDVKVRRTDLDGSFVYYTDGKKFIESRAGD